MVVGGSVQDNDSSSLICHALCSINDSRSVWPQHDGSILRLCAKNQLGDETDGGLWNFGFQTCFGWRVAGQVGKCSFADARFPGSGRMFLVTLPATTFSSQISFVSSLNQRVMAPCALPRLTQQLTDPDSSLDHHDIVTQ